MIYLEFLFKLKYSKRVYLIIPLYIIDFLLFHLTPSYKRMYFQNDKHVLKKDSYELKRIITNKQIYENDTIILIWKTAWFFSPMWMFIQNVVIQAQNFENQTILKWIAPALLVTWIALFLSVLKELIITWSNFVERV